MRLSLLHLQCRRYVHVVFLWRLIRNGERGGGSIISERDASQSVSRSFSVECVDIVILAGRRGAHVRLGCIHPIQLVPQADASTTVWGIRLWKGFVTRFLICSPSLLGLYAVLAQPPVEHLWNIQPILFHNLMPQTEQALSRWLDVTHGGGGVAWRWRSSK